jgi:hypothetical protein
VSSPPSKQSRRFLAFLAFAKCILSATASAVAAWFHPFFQLDLISEYYLPTYQPVATTFAVLATLVMYVLLARWNTSPERAWKFLVTALIVLGCCCFLCLLFYRIVGVTWDPGVWLGTVISLIWAAAYFLLFISLSVVLCVVWFLLPVEDKQSIQLSGSASQAPVNSSLTAANPITPPKSKRIRNPKPTTPAPNAQPPGGAATQPTSPPGTAPPGIPPPPDSQS